MIDYKNGFNHDELAKVAIPFFCHSGLDPESTVLNPFWIPAFAGMTVWGAFGGQSAERNRIWRNSNSICGKYPGQGIHPVS